MKQFFAPSVRPQSLIPLANSVFCSLGAQSNADSSMDLNQHSPSFLLKVNTVHPAILTEIIKSIVGK